MRRRDHVRAAGSRLRSAGVWAVVLPVSMLGFAALVLSAPAQAATPHVTRQLHTKGDSPFGVAVDPVTDTVYAANEDSGTLSVIRAGTSTRLIKVGRDPNAVAVDGTTDLVYVTHAATHGTVSVVRGSTDKVIHTIDVGSLPYGIAVDARTNRIYVANLKSNTLSVIDGATSSVVAKVDVGKGPAAVAVDATTDDVYVSDVDSQQVSVVHGGKVLTTVSTGFLGYPFSIAADATTDTIYVGLAADGAEGGVTVINGKTNKAHDLAAAEGMDCAGIGVNPHTNRVYVASGQSETGEIAVFAGSQPNARRPLAELHTAGAPEGTAVDPRTDTTYVANALQKGTVFVVSG